MNMKRYNWETWETPNYRFDADADLQKTILNCERWPNESANCRIAEFRNTYAERLKQEKDGESSSDDESNTTETIDDDIRYDDTTELWKPKYNELTHRDWNMIIAATSAPQVKYQKSETVICSESTSTGKQLYIYRIENGSVTIKVGEEESDRPYLLHGPNCLGEFNVVLPNEPINSQFVVSSKDAALLYKIDVTKLNYLCARDPVLSRKFHYYLAWKLSRRLKRVLAGNQMRQSRDVPMSEVVKKGVLLPEEVRDKNLITKFGLPAAEMILKEYKCKVKNDSVGGQSSGTFR